MSNKVLAVGDGLQNTVPQAEVVAGAGSEAVSEEGSHHYTWDVDTKYYTAQVSFVVTELSACATAVDAQALILTYDASNAMGLDPLIAWHSERRDALESVEIQLCVAVNAAGASLDRLEDWCVENGVEFVVPEGRGTDGEAEGSARVREALQAHMWPEHTRKTAPQPPPRGPEPRGAAAGGGGPTGVFPGAPPPASPLGGAVPGGGSAGCALPEAPADAAAAAAAAFLAGAGEGDGDDEDGEFEAMMAALLKVRESNSGLSDDARREAAASVALRMAKLMGLDDDDDGEEKRR